MMRMLTLCQAYRTTTSLLTRVGNQLPSTSGQAIGITTVSRIHISSKTVLPSLNKLPCLLSPRQWFLVSSLRQSTAVKKKPLPFEVDSNVPRDILVYQYKNDRFFKFITVFGLVQWVFWLNLASFSYTGSPAISEEELKQNVDEKTVLGKMVIYQARYKYKVATVCMVVGCLVTAFTFFYPHRTIRQLTLLKGGQNVCIETYAFLGRKRTFEKPLKMLSCQHARNPETNSSLSMKIRGTWFYYLLNQSHGRFLEPRLFDYVIGLKRSFV